MNNDIKGRQVFDLTYGCCSYVFMGSGMQECIDILAVPPLEEVLPLCDGAHLFIEGSASLVICYHEDRLMIK